MGQGASDGSVESQSPFDSIPPDERHGWKVMSVFPHSPSSGLGIIPYFSILTHINHQRIGSSETELVQRIREGFETQLTFLNLSTLQTSTVTVIPRRDWGGEGLLGLMISYEHSFEGSHLEVVHVLEVHHGSPAERAGLRAHVDFMLGDARRAFKSYDALDLFLTQNADQDGKLIVFNRDTFSVREVSIHPSAHWGGAGSLGCDVGLGMLHQLPLDGKREVTYEGETPQFGGPVGTVAVQSQQPPQQMPPQPTPPQHFQSAAMPNQFQPSQPQSQPQSTPFQPSPSFQQAPFPQTASLVQPPPQQPTTSGAPQESNTFSAPVPTQQQAPMTPPQVAPVASLAPGPVAPVAFPSSVSPVATAPAPVPVTAASLEAQQAQLELQRAQMAAQQAAFQQQQIAQQQQFQQYQMQMAAHQQQMQQQQSFPSPVPQPFQPAGPYSPPQQFQAAPFDGAPAPVPAGTFQPHYPSQPPQSHQQQQQQVPHTATAGLP